MPLQYRTALPRCNTNAEIIESCTLRAVPLTCFCSCTQQCGSVVIFADLLNSSKLNQIASPLLRLSAELRNAVYEHYFHGIKWHLDDHGGRPQRNRASHAFSLLLTCRQIHSEVALLRYSKSVVSTNEFTQFTTWLATRSIVQVNSITRLELQCGLWLDDHAVTSCTLPVDKHGTLLRSFPRLKHVHLQVDVTCRTQFTGRPNEHWAQIHVMELRQAFENNVPDVEVTAAYATRAEAWPIIVHIGDYSWFSGT